jgi:SEC-C motif-containing protein
MPCPCGTGLELTACCGPIIAGERPAPTAEALMRSRYTAYVEENVPYIRDSHDPETRDGFDEAATADWARRATWLGLQVLSTRAGGEGDEQGEVEFVARFRDERKVEHRHHERSKFIKREGRWYFQDGELQAQPPAVRSAPKVGRNDPCPCGSGKKYKKCCGAGAA